MNRLHRWMIEKFLPRYAHELLLDELAATDKRLAPTACGRAALRST